MGIGWWLHDLLTSKKYVPPGSLVLLPVVQPNVVNLVNKLSESTTDDQWKFLHKLSQKVFTFLQSKSKVNGKDSVIKWLKDKFSGSLENEEDKWENFKSLCEEQLQKEPKGDNLDWKYSVNVEESRLCFMGMSEDENKKEIYLTQEQNTNSQGESVEKNSQKSNQESSSLSIIVPKDFFDVKYSSYYGNLGLWDPMDEEENARPYPNLGFKGLNKLNLDWWIDFINKTNSIDVEKKFGEWYESSELKLKLK